MILKEYMLERLEELEICLENILSEPNQNNIERFYDLLEDLNTIACKIDE